MRYGHAIVVLLILLFAAQPSFAQNLETIGEQKPFDISGGITLTSAYRSLSAQDENPFFWGITANLNISVYGISIPISASFRRNSLGLGNPFNRFGMSPYYKWIKVHVGYRSMNFSKYTYNGFTFLGGGIELTPGKFRFAAFAGKMQSFIPVVDQFEGRNSFDTWDRRGWGMKIGYGTRTSFIDLIIFNAKDLTEPPIPDSLLTRPEANTMLGLKSEFVIAQRLQFKFDVASSVITNDVEASNTSVPDNVPNVDNLNPINTTTRLAFAGDGSLTILLGSFQVGGEYTRIEPSFTSLGVYNLRNDLQRYAIRASYRHPRGFFSLQGRYGKEDNNLSGIRSFGTGRDVFSISGSVNPITDVRVGFRYSNFNSEREPGFVEIEDSLRYAQQNAQFQVTPSYSWGESEIRHTISATYDKQNLTLIEGEVITENASDNLFSHLRYQIRLKEQALRVHAAIQYTQTSFSLNELARYGIDAGVSKSFWDRKLTTGLILKYHLASIDGERDGSVFHIRFRSGLKIGTKHQFNLATRYLVRNSDQREDRTDFRFQLSYGFRF